MYASLPVEVVILVAPRDWWWVLLNAGAVNAATGGSMEQELGFGVVHWGPRSSTTRRFIDTSKLEFIDPRGVHQEGNIALGEFSRR